MDLFSCLFLRIPCFQFSAFSRSLTEQPGYLLLFISRCTLLLPDTFLSMWSRWQDISCQAFIICEIFPHCYPSGSVEEMFCCAHMWADYSVNRIFLLSWTSINHKRYPSSWCVVKAWSKRMDEGMWWASESCVHISYLCLLTLLLSNSRLALSIVWWVAVGLA
jgi:hypothetical protein